MVALTGQKLNWSINVEMYNYQTLKLVDYQVIESQEDNHIMIFKKVGWHSWPQYVTDLLLISMSWLQKVRSATFSKEKKEYRT